MPLRRAGWYCYPWNLHDPRSDLASMAATGMSHVTIAASYHAGKFLQPRDPKHRVYFPEDGTVYFAADPSSYGRLKPVRASLVRGRDPLRAACDAGTLPVRAWTVLNHNSRLGWLHPEVVARNAWGDRYYYSLCPSHGDVQDYAVALCTDLAASHSLDLLLLETPGWLVYDHGYHHEFAQFDVGGELGSLMGLCFCEACVAKSAGAGINAVTLRDAVAARCDALLAGTAEPDHPLDQDLQAFHNWRATVVTDLCRRIRAEVTREVGVRAISTCQRPHRTTYLEGGDLRALSDATDGLELPIYQPTAEKAAADLSAVLEKVPDPSRLSAILRPGPPDMACEEQLRDTLAQVLAAGIEDVSFYNFGLLPQESLDWTLRAIAAARSMIL